MYESYFEIGSEVFSGSRLMIWDSDDWFKKYYFPLLTDDFKQWWIEFYGLPEQFENTYDEQHEYWKRCGFALAGWVARGKKV